MHVRRYFRPWGAACALICSCCLISMAAAQEVANTADADLLEGHSHFGEAFNEGPRQAAYLMGGTGNVSFPISTDVPFVQQFFNQGVGQLHGYWYFESERSFRQAAKMDPGCAMAYWGMAMANTQNAERARGFLLEAQNRRDQASPREQMYIDALAVKYGNDNGRADNRAFATEMGKIAEAYPDDLEAKAFMAGALLSGGRSGMEKVLEQIFAVDPMHPAHHYMIHYSDSRNRAIDAVLDCSLNGPSSPSIAHMWHMPGHIYHQLFRYEDTAWQQEASARVDHVYMIRDRVMPYEIHNFAHNNEWFTRTLIRVGRPNHAISMAMNLIDIPRHPTLNRAESRGSAAGYGQTRLYDILTEYEMWDRLVALDGTQYLGETNSAANAIRYHGALGMANAHLGDDEALAEHLDALETLFEAETKKEAEASNNRGGRGARGARGARGGRGARGRRGGRRNQRGLSTQVRDAINQVEAHASMARGDYEAAVASLGELRNVPETTMARAQLMAGQGEAALETINEAIAGAKNEVLPIAYKVEILEALGRREEAQAAFEQVRALSTRIELETPVIGRIASVAASLGYSADWRKEEIWADDVPDRPPLGSLGPLHWSPWSAPNFTLPDINGKSVSLTDFDGQPTLVIYYLGFGCLHCVAQLSVFAPLAKQYEEAGIKIVAIGLQTREQMAEALATYEAPDGSKDLPFQMLADPGLNSFREWRVYDDFEEMPLHGTFLIDGDGRVRWQEISYEPFMDAEFLLKESRRLLAQKWADDIY